MEEVWESVKAFFTNAGLKIVIGIAILVIGLIICRIIKALLKRAFKRAKRDEAMSHFIISLTDILLKIIILVSALATMGINTASLITVLGTCGVAIGLSLKDSLGNLAGGVLIIYNKPFKKGDLIEASGVSGKVSTINLFNTVLLTKDNKEVVIPNGALSSDKIINYSARPTRRIEFNFSISYDTDFRVAEKIILDICEAHPKVLRDPAPTCRLNEHAESALVLVARAWVLTSDYSAVFHDIMEEVKLAFDEAHIEIPYNKLDVHLTNGVGIGVESKADND